MGGKLIQSDPGPSRFVVSIRVSKVSQVGDLLPGGYLGLSGEPWLMQAARRRIHTPPGTTEQQAIAELEADYAGKEASSFQKLQQRFITCAPRARGSAQLQSRR